MEHQELDSELRDRLQDWAYSPADKECESTVWHVDEAEAEDA